MVNFFVAGIPTPMPRPRFHRWGNRVVTYSQKDAWYAMLKLAAIKHKPKEELTGPLRLECNFMFPRPKHINKSKVLKDTRPDIDNLIKKVMDALQDANFFFNDGQIACIRSYKVYAGKPESAGCRIEVSQI